MKVHIFSTIFTQGNNFFDLLHASLEDKAFPKGDYFLRKEFAPVGANSFL